MKVVSLGFKQDKTLNITVQDSEIDKFLDHVKKGDIYESMQAPNKIWINPEHLNFIVVSEPQELEENGKEQQPQS